MTDTLEPHSPKSRFAFGRNWRNFLRVLDEDRIASASASLQTMLNVETLVGKRFLDIGSGSGLFSLAARRLGAQVHSVDYDHVAVACARELKARYFPNDVGWRIEQGSILDTRFIEGLGRFDIVYSWGVLHHTGAMWRALDNALVPVAANGVLFIAIYNYQTPWSPVWTKVKQLYNATPPLLRPFVVLLCLVPIETRSFLKATMMLQPGRYIRAWTHNRGPRGMSRWHDWVDWVGGYPFETAKPEEIFAFYRERGCSLEKLKTCGGGLGCNEFVFRNANND